MTARGIQDPATVAAVTALVSAYPGSLGPVLAYARALLEKRRAERAAAEGKR